MRSFGLVVLCAVLSLPVSVRAEEGLVAYYSFDEGTGEVAHDASGKGNDGKLIPSGGDVHAGPAWGKGKHGAALNFDGRNDLILCGNAPSLQIGKALTVALWLNTAGAKHNQYMVSKYSWNLWLHGNDEDPSLWDVSLTTRDAADKAWGELRAYKAAPVSKWVFVAVVYSAAPKERSIYVNGAPAKSEPSGGAMGAPDKESLVLGRYAATEDSFYCGLMDEVRIYDRALSAAEVKALYTDGLAKVDQDVTPETVKASAAQPVPLTLDGYIGLKNTPPATALSAVPAKLALENARVRCEISPRTGNVSAIISLPANRKAVENSSDIYIFDGKRIPDEGDAATGWRSAGLDPRKGFELVCTNKELPGIEITKRYLLEEDRLVKTVCFKSVSGESDGKLLFLRSSLRLDQEFYKDGFFYRPIWSSGGALGPGAVPFVPGESVMEPRNFKDAHAACAVYLKPAWNLGVAQYKFKVNGYFEGTRTEAYQGDLIPDIGTFLPGGWELYMTGDIARPGDFLSVESHFMLFEGDARKFHRHQLAIPEYAELIKFRAPMPEWFHKVKYIGNHTYSTLLHNQYALERIAAACKTLGEDEYMMYLVCGWSLTGDYPSQGKIASREGHNYVLESTAEKVKEDLKRYRDVAPGKVKLSLYTWQASASDKSEQYMEKHPDWLLRDQDGAFVSFGSGETNNYGKKIVTQGQIDWIADQYRRMFDFYGIDYSYIDGGAGGEFVNYAPQKIFVHGYHGVLLGEALKRAAEEKGGAHMQNITVHPETSHCAYLETLSDAKVYDRRDWRVLANIYWLSKCYQPEGWSNALNWADPNYGYRSIMYGFPLEMATPWFSMDLSYMFHTGDEAFELKDSRLVPGARVHPDWWAFETDTLESALLKQGGAYLLPLISHSDAEKTEKISVSVAGLDLNPAQPVYLWQFQPLIDFGLDWTAPTPAARETVARVLRTATIQNGTIAFEARLRPRKLDVYALTQTPAVVYSVNGRQNDFLLPASRGVAIDGAEKDGKVELSVASDASTAEILILLPGQWQGAEVSLNGKPAAAKLLTLGAQRFALISVPKGKSVVTASSRQGAAAASAPLASPTINSYFYHALGYYPEQGKPEIQATRLDGKDCWELKGAGALTNMFSVSLKGMGGVAFSLNAGTAKGSFQFAAGQPNNRLLKNVPLDFAGWKEFSIPVEAFDEKPQGVQFENADRYSFVMPDGVMYMADLRFLPAAARAGKEEPAARQRVVARPALQPPVLDGNLDDPCWQNAAAISFSAGGGDQTEVRVAYDKTTLYIAANCRESITKPPSKSVRDFNAICNAPDIELFLIPAGAKSCYQMVTNPANAQWDGVYALDTPLVDTDWNSKWKVATSIGWGVGWVAELAIPFADLAKEPPKPGEVWAAGFFRQSPMGLSGWIYHGGQFFQPEGHFGDLVFSDSGR